jgi:hypothetical protein
LSAAFDFDLGNSIFRNTPARAGRSRLHLIHFS